MSSNLSTVIRVHNPNNATYLVGSGKALEDAQHEFGTAFWVAW